MVFSSVEFLFYFLPLALAVYLVTPRPARNGVLFALSLLFYTWGGGSFVGVLVLSLTLNYSLGYLAGWARQEGRERHRQLAVGASVLANVCLLGYFKYANFFVDQLNGALERLGADGVGWAAVALPIGISFYTFHSMSYTIDVARGRSEHLRNPLDYGLYIVLFPQLIAGPIIRYHEIADQIRNRTTTMEDLGEGSVRFVHGLAKKVIVADTLAPVADAAFAAEAGGLSAAGAWFGIAAYTFQIYFDFSGYSDMAIGLARMFGFRFPENFRRPYSALSVTDFWRRWHITLSNWFRDYLYVPLGGNRHGSARTNGNLLLVFLATGIWHGAAWTFVLWGLVHGAGLLWERQRGTRHLDGAPHEGWARARTLLFVAMAWVLFRASSAADALEYYGALAGRGLGALADDPVLRAVDLRELLVFAVGVATVLLPRDFVSGRRLVEASGRRATTSRIALVGVGFPLALVLVVSGTFSPFLYFQF
jgi:alginate O-acetyltransferase complex protein AlgI